MDYKCDICNRQFGENRIKYEYHLTTKQHKHKASKCQPVLNTNANTEQLLKLVKQLTEQVQSLQSGNTSIQSPQQRETNVPYSFTQIIKNKIFTVDEMISRTNPNILKPEETWVKFIFNAYRYKSRDNYITCEYKPHQIAANLLLTKFYNTPQELLPIIVLNKERGKNGKICYYNKSNNFEIKTNISKRENIDLYNRIDMYIFKSFSQLWCEDKLKEIYRDMPIELKNKIHFNSRDDDKISFLDFKCFCKDNTHGGCYKEMICDDNQYRVWRYRNQNLTNIDGKKFMLDDDNYIDFVNEYVDAIEEHENGFIYNEYREQKELAMFDEESEKTRYKIVNEVYEKIIERCSFIVREEDE